MPFSVYLRADSGDFSFVALAWTIIVAIGVGYIAQIPGWRYPLVYVAITWGFLFLIDMFWIWKPGKYRASEYAFDVLLSVTPTELATFGWHSGKWRLVRAILCSLFALLLRVPFILVAPLVFILVQERISHEAFAREVRERYLSSYKPMFLLGGVVSLFAFFAKVYIYARWANIANWWNEHLSFIDLYLAPKSFYPWHFTVALAAGTLLLSVKLIDRLYTVLDSGGKLEQHEWMIFWLKVALRFRTILSIYNWLCLLWISIPALSGLSFPPVTWKFFPR